MQMYLFTVNFNFSTLLAEEIIPEHFVLCGEDENVECVRDGRHQIGEKVRKISPVFVKVFVDEREEEHRGSSSKVGCVADGGESLASEKRDHNHRDKTFDDVEASADITVNRICPQSSGFYQQKSLTFASLVKVIADFRGVIGQLEEGVQVEQDGEEGDQDHVAPAAPHIMPDSWVRRVAYIEVAFQCNCHQGEGAARISNLKNGVGVDDEDGAVLGLEVGGESRCNIDGNTSCRYEDVEEGEKDKQFCKSWLEVETAAKQDGDAYEIAQD